MSPKSRYVALLRLHQDKILDIQDRFPQIGYEWFRGMTQNDIVKEYDIEGDYGVSSDVASMLVRLAIRGAQNDKENECFQGLIRRDLYDLVAINRKSSNILRNDRFMEMSRSGVIASGKIPVGEEEKRDGYCLSLMDRFQNVKGNPSWSKVAAVLNERYGVCRSWGNVRNNVYKYKKKNNIS